jgi:hypothetical protein
MPHCDKHGQVYGEGCTCPTCDAERVPDGGTFMDADEPTTKGSKKKKTDD